METSTNDKDLPEDRTDCEPAPDNSALLEGIYEVYCDKIYSYALYRVFTREAAEDVTSTVFLRLAEKIDSLNFEDGPAVRNWLYGTARNAARIYLKSDKRRAEVLNRARWERAKSPESGDDSDGFDNLDWPVLYEALAHLRQTHQEIIILRFRQRLKHEDIASILEMEPVTVRVNLSRALKELRRQLEHLFGESPKGN